MIPFNRNSSFGCCFWLAAGTYSSLFEMASRIPSRLLAGISEVLRASPNAEQPWSGRISSVQTSVFARDDASGADLPDTEKYPSFFLGALEFAIFPHARRPQYAAASGINNRLLAWKWAASQIQDNVRDEQWMHANCLKDIADIFSRTFAMMGNCRFPLYITGELAEVWFDVWRLINEQRMSRNRWPF